MLLVGDMYEHREAGTFGGISDATRAALLSLLADERIIIPIDCEPEGDEV